MSSSMARLGSRPWVVGACLVLVLGAFVLGRRSVGVVRTGPASEKTAAAPAGQLAARADPDARRAPERSDRGIVRFEGEGLKLAHLRIERVGFGSLPSRLEVTGTVEPNLGGVVKVTPRVAGRITSVRVNVGDTVRAGQALATLASTELAQAQATYRQARSRVAVTWSNLRRQKELASLGAFGRPTIEAARTQAAAAQAEIEIAQTEVTAAQAGVTEAASQSRALSAAAGQSETQVTVAESRFHRADLLLKEELVSRQDWEQARAEYQRSQADLVAARANVSQGQAKVETAEANLKAAQTRLAAARKRGQITAQALAREEAVYQGRYMTTREIVEAEAAWRQAQLDERAAAENVRLLGGVVGAGNVMTLAAPLGGRVTERLVTLGETVIPEKPLFTIVDLRTVWVQLNVYQQNLPAVHVGQAVAVTSDTAPGHTFRGALSYIGDVVDEATRTVKVRAVIQNAGGHPQGPGTGTRVVPRPARCPLRGRVPTARRAKARQPKGAAAPPSLRPQTFVRGAIATGGRTRSCVAPREAIQQLDGEWVVFVPADKPGEFRPRPVEIGAERGNVVEIRSGLRAGERIVTRNAFLLKSQSMKGELGEDEEEGGRK